MDEIRFRGDLQRLEVKPGDVFVLSTSQWIDMATADRVKAMLREALGAEAKVLVLSGDMRLGVVGAGAITPKDPLAGLRKATADDIHPGQQVFYASSDARHQVTVGEVINPSSRSEAFRATDGRVYGQAGAFVRERCEAHHGR